ncbi:MAG: cell filamentation protein Fic [Elusimicrobia bacterium GWA2_69_24]|nr:MAG: cell filamentation protein Fic [Elusimicrobia bacterium GWA2_69_24]HBL16234.1 Fic family protein [Elusimicrobiota bacterium]
MGFSPKFTITNALTAALTKIERARGFLEAAKLSEDWISEMQNRALVLEAHHTTHIEGTHLTLEESEKLLAGKKVPGADPDDARELLNYREAFDLVTEYLDNGEPLTEALIREIHKRLVKGVRGDKASPGQYRKGQNYVVNSKTKQVIYTPPPPAEVPGLMEDMVNWLRSEHGVNPVLEAGIAQFQIVHIHPFDDGNGRTSRLLSTLCLYRKGYDFKRLFTISEYYDRDRTSFYKAVQGVREKGMDMTGWLEYFTDGLSTQMREVQEHGEQVIKTDVLVRKHALNARQRLLVRLVMEKGALTIHELEGLCKGVPRRTLQRDLQGLVTAGLLVTEGATAKLRYLLKK